MLRSSFGAFLGLALVIGVAKLLGELAGVDEWFMASLGASALLVFALPRSPMAQPWAVIGGNAVSALAGLLSTHLLGGLFIAMPFAVTISIFLMFAFRCLHPPAAAVALIVVLGGISNIRFVFFPVFIDSAILVLAGAVYSNLTGKKYPNSQQS